MRAITIIMSPRSRNIWARLPARLPEGALRDAVLENRDDELGMDSAGGRSHDAIWLEFAARYGCGIRKKLLASRRLAEVREFDREFLRRGANRTPTEALAAFYALRIASAAPWPRKGQRGCAIDTAQMMRHANISRCTRRRMCTTAACGASKWIA